MSTLIYFNIMLFFNRPSYTILLKKTEGAMEITTHKEKRVTIVSVSRRTDTGLHGPSHR